MLLTTSRGLGEPQATCRAQRRQATRLLLIKRNDPDQHEPDGAAAGFELGELNTTQNERWQRSIEVIAEGQSRQRRLFTDREGQAPEAEDACELILSSLAGRIWRF